jgi:preprotein translocase subunit SecY
VLSAFASAFRTPDLRKKLLFTLGIIALFRLGSVVPTPGVDYKNIQKCIEAVQDNSIYGLINLFSGGALLQLSVFALGIMPYITASIIIQLLTVVIPRLENLRQEGQAGQATLTQYTRYLTIGLAVLQSTGIIALARVPGRLFQGCNESLLHNNSIMLVLTMILTMTAGTGVIMWLGENITDRGVGNGMSLLIFTSIIATFPGQLWQISTINGPFALILTLIVGVAIIAGVVYVEQAQRRIPVQYAKRMVGRKMYGGTSTYIPLKVNMAGVIPVIFASSIMMIVPTFAQFFGTGGVAGWFNKTFGPSTFLYIIGEAILTIIFTYFYTAVTFNPIDQADNLKKYGGFIPGVRPGRPTAEYLDRILTRLTLPGALFLAALAVLPWIMSRFLNVPFYFGGTSLLIVVGVALDTMRQMEAQLLMRHYEGFLK